jgi:hypothetical protein
VTESAADTAAPSSTSACTDQSSAAQCPSPPTSHSVEGSETVPACASSLLSPAVVRTSTRSTANSEHPFFRWLLRAPASDAAAQHFRRHYLQSSPMCICTVFPVYSSKVDLQPASNPSARRFLNSLSHLCLHCIMEVAHFDELADLKRYWSRAMQREWDAFYLAPEDADRSALADAVTEEQRIAQDMNIFDACSHSWASTAGSCWRTG